MSLIGAHPIAASALFCRSTPRSKHGVEGLVTTNEKSDVDPALVERIVVGVLKAFGHTEPETVPTELPPFISDRDAIRLLYGSCSRAHFYNVLVRDPRFPPPVEIGGRLKVRRTADHLRFLRERAREP